MKNKIKLIFWGVIINLLLILLFKYEFVSIEFFNNITLDIKIITMFICILYYLLLIYYHNGNVGKMYFNIRIINLLIKIIIILGFFNLHITFPDAIKFGLNLIFAIIISLGGLLIYLILLALDSNNILGLFGMILSIIISIGNIIIFLFLLIFITIIYKKDKIERVLSIIYLPVLYYMLISGIEFINNFIKNNLV